MRNLFRMVALGLAVAVSSAGLAVAQDRDDYRYDRDRDYRYDDLQSGLRIAHEIGYQDGAQVAREDAWHGKPFNPYPRGKYRNADRGYRHEYGSKNEYRERYADGYRDGYRSAFRRYHGHGGYGYDR
jgi:hypothetical protein